MAETIPRRYVRRRRTGRNAKRAARQEKMEASPPPMLSAAPSHYAREACFSTPAIDICAMQRRAVKATCGAINAPPECSEFRVMAACRGSEAAAGERCYSHRSAYEYADEHKALHGM